ncbi:MAG: glycerophosphodiester phosphodiesterase family protein [Bacilli bacterium]|nr:glycerophosphodiester phosphodiesterase family protein [Bacilli bacterium]MDD4406731.1 glycerophosphodiester phosphodiesterase family protein [Bacilli bacterium]
MILIAHRGLYNEKIGENTISAFDNAFNNSYEGIELDVRKTKDNKIVVIHDSFISRVSNGTGLVKNMTYYKLLKYNFGKSYIERIPLLKEVINRYTNKIILIELKESILITELNLNDKNIYYISSFNYDYIKNIPKSKKYKKGIINYAFNANIDLDDIDFIMILDILITDEIYNFYEKRGIEIIIYGVGKNYNINLNKDYIKKTKYII